MPEHSTTVSVQLYLDALAKLDGDAPAEPVVRELLGRAANRLQMLCSSLLHRSYPRLTRGPSNLRSEEMLSALVERLIKALRQVRPTTVREFFALANQHIRWELNDAARRLDVYSTVELGDVPTRHVDFEDEAAPMGPTLIRILDAIDSLQPEAREAFDLVRLQGLTQSEAAAIAGCSERTLQRRLNRSLVLLTDLLGDLRRPLATIHQVQSSSPGDAS